MTSYRETQLEIFQNALEFYQQCVVNDNWPITEAKTANKIINNAIAQINRKKKEIKCLSI